MPAQPSVGDNLNFLDLSAGAPTSWSWDLGDGSTSSFQSPSYWLFGLRQNAAERTNIAFANAGTADAILVRVTLRSADGTKSVVLDDVRGDHHGHVAAVVRAAAERQRQASPAPAPTTKK